MESTSIIIDINDDEDVSRNSWDLLQEQLPSILAILNNIDDLDNCNLLICDNTGISTSASVLCAYLIIYKNIRLEEFIDICKEKRPSVNISLSMRRGLDQLQLSLDDKKLKKLNNKVRNSAMLSIGF